MNPNAASSFVSKYGSRIFDILVIILMTVAVYGARRLYRAVRRFVSRKFAALKSRKNRNN